LESQYKRDETLLSEARELKLTVAGLQQALEEAKKKEASTYKKIHVN
jgi:hypothetical protein